MSRRITPWWIECRPHEFRRFTKAAPELDLQRLAPDVQKLVLNIQRHVDSLPENHPRLEAAKTSLAIAVAKLESIEMGLQVWKRRREKGELPKFATIGDLVKLRSAA